MTATIALARGIAAAAPAPLALRRGGRVVAFDGNVVTAIGIDATVGSRALVGAGCQPAEIVGFVDGRALLLGLAPLVNVAPGAAVIADGVAAAIAGGPALLGRVIDGLGQPLDGQGPVRADRSLAAAGCTLGPAQRLPVSEPLDTGVRAIDGLLSFGRGQRVGIMAGTGVGKSVLLGQIARWAAADVVIVALIGERGREITDFIERELAGAGRERILTIAVPASEAPLQRVRGAERAFAIAEGFRGEGRHVLLILDSLSRVIHGARDVALARGEAVGARGYPASAMALIATLAERAGGERASGGAISLIATVLDEGSAGGNDGGDPLLDAARGVFDGHVLLSRGLAGRGQFPAIDLVRSASRVMADVCAPEHLAAAARFRRMTALIEDNRDLVLMGAYAPGADAELDAALALAPRLEAYRCQPRGERVPADLARRQLAELVPA